MKPERKLAETRTPDGKALALYAHDGAYSLRLGHDELMHSTATASELALGLQARGVGEGAMPTILIGGLGLGYTLSEVLRVTPPGARITVAELLPDVVSWNRTLLRELNGAALDDPRVEVIVGDVGQLLAGSAPDSWDVMLLDVDNGPSAMVGRSNARMYRPQGLAQIAQVLRPGGRVAFWSAGEAPQFERQLRRSGLHVQVLAVRRHSTARSAACRIYVGVKSRPRPH